MHTPALLAPGGDYLSAKAAILAGADEVYVGLGRFNARRRATNLEIDDIRRLSALARSRGAAIYVTTNVLITDDEFGEMLELIGECNAAGISGVIVQDPGLLALLRSRLPELEVHVSTQMTVHSRAQIDWLAKFNVQRINLARELTLEEIALLSAHAAERNIGTEVFVHGAYCVSYSGQCFMSSFMGGQSGNRGVCFQPCRRFYTPEGSEERILSLSLKDNNALPHVRELAEAGVGALKIEGRMKGPWYVDALVRAYRAALDGREPQLAAAPPKTVFNRGFSAGYLEGRVTEAMFADHPFDASLIPAGMVAGYRANERRLSVVAGEGDRKPAAGDAGVIYTEENRFIALITVEGEEPDGSLTVSIREALKGRIEPGMRLFLQSDTDRQDEFLERLKETPEPRIPLSVEVEATTGEPLHSRWRAAYGEEDIAFCEVDSESEVDAARSQGLDAERLEAQFGKLGGTPFELEALSFRSDEPVFLPLGELNGMRRRAAELLTRRNGIEAGEFRAAAAARTSFPPVEAAPPRLLVLAEEEQLEELTRAAALTGRPGDILLLTDPLRGGYFRGGERGGERSRGLELEPPAGAGGFSFPAVIQDDQFEAAAAFLQRVRRQLPEVTILTANSGIAGLAQAAGLHWIAASDLHITNARGAAVFLERGARGAVASRELSGSQLFRLLESVGAGRIYLPVFGPLLLMTTRQCLYRRSFECPKEVSDAGCREGCSRSGWITDEQGNSFLIEKRPGGHTELYNRGVLALPEAVPRFAGKAAGFLLDLRLGRLAGDGWRPAQLLGVFDALAREELSREEAREELSLILGSETPLTRGNYKRGLQ